MLGFGFYCTTDIFNLFESEAHLPLQTALIVTGMEGSAAEQSNEFLPFTSAKELLYLVWFRWLFVIFIKPCGREKHGPRKNPLNFGVDPKQEMDTKFIFHFCQQCEIWPWQNKYHTS